MKPETSFIYALQRGERKYQSDVPCKHHPAPLERYTKNKGCVQCVLSLSAKRYAASISPIKPITLKVHADDREVLEMFAAQLLAARQS